MGQVEVMCSLIGDARGAQDLLWDSGQTCDQGLILGNLRGTQIEAHSTNCLSCRLQEGQGHESWGKTEELLQTVEAGAMLCAECNHHRTLRYKRHYYQDNWQNSERKVYRSTWVFLQVVYKLDFVSKQNIYIYIIIFYTYKVLCIWFIYIYELEYIPEIHNGQLEKYMNVINLINKGKNPWMQTIQWWNPMPFCG